MKTVKSLKSQNKGLKDENKALRQELHSRSLTIEKHEKTIFKLQNDEAHQKQVQELSNDVRRAEMKLRKMKERRNYYRNEKDQYKCKVDEMQKDNEALYTQISNM